MFTIFNNKKCLDTLAQHFSFEASAKYVFKQIFPHSLTEIKTVI